MEDVNHNGPAKDIATLLTQKGYRITPQRTMILEAIQSSDQHISAEEIHAQVVAKYPNVNISTVYRTLELLKKLGLVTETDLGGGRFRYHPAEKGHHHHLVCQECGNTIDLDNSELYPLKEVLLKKHKFIADLQHLAIMGRCVNCKK
ncbi:MAG: transcriptional repressor [Dehalococcoidales bacterium]|nr:transcriptional repressor [Dehalococcoidales bacterium]